MNKLVNVKNNRRMSPNNNSEGQEVVDYLIDDIPEPKPTILSISDDYKNTTSESEIDENCCECVSNSAARLPPPPPPLLEDFYHEQNIFITGGTGFVGKVLIEKLLYEFPTIGTIYVMIRPKSGQLIRKRLEELTKCQVFDRLRAKYPERLSKLQAISSDIRFPGLGINPIDLQTLVENVSIIFHSAATIRFDEPLKYALTINTLGTKRVVQLAKKLSNLRAFVHVSTAYCTVDKRNIEEKVYFEPISPNKVLEMVDWMDDATINRLADTLYSGRPCSYHYTKSLAENLLAQEVANGHFHQDPSTSHSSPGPLSDTDQIPSSSTSSHLNNVISNSQNTNYWRPFPVAIVRPSIITPSWRDPFPGWIDNYNGTTGFLVASGKGVLRSMHVHKDYQCDLIPVDIVINTCILSAWYVAVHHYNPGNHNSDHDHNGYEQRFSMTLTNDERNSQTTSEDVFVVNCVSGTFNPITWSQILDIAMPLMYKYPSLEMFRVPGVRYHQSQFLNKINVYLEHTVPAYVVDFIFKFMGLSPILDQVYQKVHRATTALEFFTTNEWTYSGSNMLRLMKFLEDSYRKHKCRDKPCRHLFQQTSERFQIDIRQLKWTDYFRDYVLGIRKYLLKEDPATIPKAQNQLIMLYTLTLLGKILVTGTVCYQLMYPGSMARKSFRMLLTNNETENSRRTAQRILGSISSSGKIGSSFLPFF